MRVLDDESFSSFIAAPGLRAVLFVGHNSEPSRQQYRELAGLVGVQLKADQVGAIDTLVHDETRRAFNITRLPTIVFFADGAPVHILAGYQNRQRIEAALSGLTRGRTPLAA